MRSNMAVSEALENEHRASQRSSEECSQIVFSVLATGIPLKPEKQHSMSLLLSHGVGAHSSIFSCISKPNT